MLERGELLVLSNNKEYAVVSSIIYEGVNYVYILDTEEYRDYKFCRYEEEQLRVVKDEELVKTLIAKFNTDLKENLSSLIGDSE